jgi:general secretion pathway protein N
MRVRIAILLAAGLFAAGHAAALAAATPPAIDPRDDAMSQWRAPATSASPPATAEAVQSGNPLWAIPLRLLTATRERPLFAPSRRPPPPAVTNTYRTAAVPPPPLPKRTEPEKPQLSLIGTIAGQNEGIGVFVDRSAKTVVRLKTGEGHNGWVLRAVRRREVVLEKGRETAVLALPAVETTKTTATVPPRFGKPAFGGTNASAPPRSPAGAAPVSLSGDVSPGSPAPFNPFPLPPDVQLDPTFNPLKPPVRAPRP